SRSCPGNIGQKHSTATDSAGRIQKPPSCLPRTGLWVGIFEKTMPVQERCGGGGRTRTHDADLAAYSLRSAVPTASRAHLQSACCILTKEYYSSTSGVTSGKTSHKTGWRPTYSAGTGG